jgi:DNA-binding ferritin-like protein
MRHNRESRYKAAAALIATGNSKVAARESGVPSSTIRHWRVNDPDFASICEELRDQFSARIKGQLAEIIEKANVETLDRLEHGDAVRDKGSGELVRQPIKAKESAIISAVSLDKLRLLENQPTQIKADSSDLKALAEQFAKLSEQWQEKQATVVVVQDDGERLDAD